MSKNYLAQASEQLEAKFNGMSTTGQQPLYACEWSTVPFSGGMGDKMSTMKTLFTPHTAL